MGSGSWKGSWTEARAAPAALGSSQCIEYLRQVLAELRLPAVQVSADEPALVLRLPHWSLRGMREAFRWPLERYLFFGGYPGAASLVRAPRRWARHIKDALVETTISRDVLLLTRVDKPALLRQLFELACSYSGQELSYQKMLGELQDAGAGRRVTAIEVKSGRRRGRLSGLEAFDSAFRPVRKLLVGGDGIPLESFLERPVEHWVRR